MRPTIFGTPLNRRVAFVGAIGFVAIAATSATVVMAQDNGIPIGVSQYSLIVSFHLYLLAGLVLLLRRPENRLAWLLAGVGLVPALGAAAQEYARYALVEHPGAAGGVVAAWLNQLWWFANLAGVFIFVPLLFPTGHLPSPRWRWIARTAAVAVAAVILMEAFGPDLSGQNGYEVANPLAVGWVQGAEEGLIGSLVFAVIGLCMLATIASLVLRLRRSEGIERQQLKWFVFAGVLVIGVPLLELLGVQPAGDAAFDFILALLPISIGIAVLRYRLYDIDRIISRTVTYAVLTAVLGGLYLAAVTSLTTITAPVTRDSPVAVAAATLLAAGAFGPARRRIQDVVDRRFNRARYDAARTATEFRAHLRDQLDLTTIASDLQRVVTGSVEPSRCAVWLRPEAHS